jgi:TRAP transporter TAXI family solute receptor
MTIALSATACEQLPDHGPPVTLTLGTGGPGGAFYALGPVLARFWSEHIPQLDVRVEPGGSGVNVEWLQAAKADIAFTQADIAYAAYSRGTEADSRPHLQLRAIAVLWMNTVHVAVPKSSTVRSVEELRGRRVAVTSRGGGTETLARIVLGAYDLTYADITPQFGTFVETVEQMRDRGADAAFVVAGVPAVAVTELSERSDVRLLRIPRDRLATMRAQYPFLQPVLVPRGTYRGIDQDVETLGVSNLLMCRKDLDERLVYQLTKSLFDAIPALEAAHPVASLIDPEEAPATPIPLHPGAARFYREREITR